MTPDESQAAPPSEEELRAQLEAELKRVRVDDVLLQTVVSLVNLGARRAGLAGGGEDEIDLGQVEAAIEGVQAVLPVLERRGQAADLRPVRDALSQLQLAYARARGAAPSGAPPAGEQQPQPAGEGGKPGEPQEPKQPGAGPAESSGRLWVPGR